MVGQREGRIRSRNLTSLAAKELVHLIALPLLQGSAPLREVKEQRPRRTRAGRKRLGGGIAWLRGSNRAAGLAKRLGRFADTVSFTASPTIS
jgi:hypothetical protein